MWDNSARRSTNANIFIGSTPSIYKQWLKKIVTRTLQIYTGDEQIVFINAWNEWAEGCHLEPDQKWGHDYLEATRDALAAVPKMDSSAHVTNSVCKPHPLKQIYWRSRQSISGGRTILAAMLWQVKQWLPPQ